MSVSLKKKPTQKQPQTHNTNKTEETLKKIDKMKQTLNNLYYGREKEIEALLTGLVTSEPVLLLGNVGTAKTSIIEDISKLIKEAKPFTYLMTRFTEPDELFGTIDLKKYKEGILQRKIDNTSLTSDIVFLDEIFKASSAIRNALLRVMNEKQYKYGDQTVDVDWLALYTASNEISYDDEDQAFLDRLVIRQFVKPVLKKNPTKLLEKGLSLKKNRKTLKPIIEKEEIKQLRKEIDRMVDNFIKQRPGDLEKISRALADLAEEVDISDRKAVKVLPVSAGIALVNGRTEITLNDIAEAIRFLAPRTEADLEKINEILEKYRIKEMNPTDILEDTIREVNTVADNMAGAMQPQIPGETVKTILGTTLYQMMQTHKLLEDFLEQTNNIIEDEHWSILDGLIVSAPLTNFLGDMPERLASMMNDNPDIIERNDAKEALEEATEMSDRLNETLSMLEKRYGAKIYKNKDNIEKLKRILKIQQAIAISEALASMVFLKSLSRYMADHVAKQYITRAITIDRFHKELTRPMYFSATIIESLEKALTKTLLHTVRLARKLKDTLTEKEKKQLAETLGTIASILVEAKYDPLESGLEIAKKLTEDPTIMNDPIIKGETIKTMKEFSEMVNSQATEIDNTINNILEKLSKKLSGEEELLKQIKTTTEQMRIKMEKNIRGKLGIQ